MTLDHSTLLWINDRWQNYPISLKHSLDQSTKTNMILEHSKDPVSAKYNSSTSSWEIQEKTKYRWLSPKNKPTSDYFYDISHALEWIIKHDTETN